VRTPTKRFMDECKSPKSSSSYGRYLTTDWGCNWFYRKVMGVIQMLGIDPSRYALVAPHAGDGRLQRMLVHLFAEVHMYDVNPRADDVVKRNSNYGLNFSKITSLPMIMIENPNFCRKPNKGEGRGWGKNSGIKQCQMRKLIARNKGVCDYLILLGPNSYRSNTENRFIKGYRLIDELSIECDTKKMFMGASMPTALLVFKRGARKYSPSNIVVVPRNMKFSEHGFQKVGWLNCNRRRGMPWISRYRPDKVGKTPVSALKVYSRYSTRDAWRFLERALVGFKNNSYSITAGDYQLAISKFE
jgi:hypothetical protein